MSAGRRVDFVMGTAVDIEVRRCGLDPVDLEQLFDNVVARLRQIDKSFSTYAVDSEISRLGRGELATSDLSADVSHVLDLCEKLYANTDGYFDAYRAAEMEPAAINQHSVAANARPIEPSGVVKGWAIEVAADMLRASGVRDFCVNLGGDLFASGEREPNEPWRIGLQHPHDKTLVMAVVQITDMALATSGLYERGNHIAMPEGRTTDLISVSMIGADATLTDAYATAVCAMGREGLEWAADLAGFGVFGVDHDGMTHHDAVMAEYLAPER